MATTNSTISGDGSLYNSPGFNDTITFTGEGHKNNTVYGEGREINNSIAGNDSITLAGNGNIAYGDALIMRGNSQGGNDTLLGSGGVNIFYGDALDIGSGVGGQDTFVLTAGFTDNGGTDGEYNIIKDFRSGEDIIGLADGLAFEDLSFGVDEFNPNTVILSIVDTNDVLAWVENTDIADLTEADFTSL